VWHFLSSTASQPGVLIQSQLLENLSRSDSCKPMTPKKCSRQSTVSKFTFCQVWWARRSIVKKGISTESTEGGARQRIKQGNSKRTGLFNACIPLDQPQNTHDPPSPFLPLRKYVTALSKMSGRLKVESRKKGGCRKCMLQRRPSVHVLELVAER
jgi:hypothetical protein